MISAAKSVQEFQQTAEPVLCNPSVWLSSIQFNSFRNYPSLSIKLQDRPVILVGPNGAGKTNILEGVSLLAPGRGLRRSKAHMWPHKGLGERESKASKTWSVSAEVNTEEGPVFVGTGTKIQDDGEPGRRIVKVNGEISSQTTLAESFAVTWLTPEMDDILASTPSEKDVSLTGSSLLLILLMQEDFLGLRNYIVREIDFWKKVRQMMHGFQL